MSNLKNRREFVKLLVAGGLGLYVASCDSSENRSQKNPSNSKRGEEDVDEIMDFLTSNNVTYLKVNDEKFNKYQQGFNLATPKTPLIIALCLNTEGVSESIRYAQQQNLKVAVKSGGHSFENYSSMNGGMQINLALMNKVCWKENNRAVIQPACTLKEMYEETLPKGRLIPAGSCAGVGVGGIALGGGYGFFARKYGLTCDSIEELTFVDGKGKIYQLKNGDELMWALKGGGNGNFGVVTEFTFKTQQAPKHFIRYRFKSRNLDHSKTKLLLQKYFQYSSQLPNECHAAFVLNYKTLVLLVTNYGDMNEPLSNMISVFSELCDESSIGNPQSLSEALPNYYGRTKPIYFKNASAGYYENYKSIEKCIDEILDLIFMKSGFIYQISTMGGNINNSEFERNSSYPHRDLPYLSELQYYYNERSDPRIMLERFEQIQRILLENGINKQYRNYPDINFKNWETAYYGSNYKRLQEIKQNHDPMNLFSHQQTIKSKNI